MSNNVGIDIDSKKTGDGSETFKGNNMSGMNVTQIKDEHQASFSPTFMNASNIVPSLVFENLIDKINIIDSDIEFLLENSFLDTMNVVLSRFLYLESDLEDNLIPLFAFVQKTNIFYAFVEGGGWVELPKDKLCLFLMRVQMKISKAFHEWKKQRATRIRDEESFAILCDKTLIKIMGNEFNQDSTFGKMRASMYNKMKTDMKAMVEYEFEF